MVSRACEHSAVEEEVLRIIKPGHDERERVAQAVEQVKSKLSKALSSAGIPAKLRIEGSFARDTWLSGELDVDLFVLMPPDACLDMISSGKVLSVVREALSEYPIEDRHAQHPYLRVKVGEVWVEVVPGCAVARGSEALTAVDRTPFHTEYVNARLDELMRDEVRLLKRFMKGVGVYGAEVAVRGFSGYLTELLVIKYKCFRSVLLAAAYQWKPPVVVDLVGFKEDLAKKFRGSVMVVPDPVDPKRNAAAAVSPRSLAVFALAARLYLENPSRDFFFPPQRGLVPGDVVKALGDRIGSVVLVQLEPQTRTPPDVLWGIAWRLARVLAKGVKYWGFEVVDYSAYVDEEVRRAWIAVEVLSNPLSHVEVHLGPPVWDRENAAHFLAKYLGTAIRGPWVNHEGRLVVLRRRRYADVAELVRERIGEWMPGSARKFKVQVLGAESAVHVMSRGELRWLYEFATKIPHWMRRRG